MSIVLPLGKYAAFVWPAYGFSALGIVTAVVLTLLAHYRAKVRLSALGRDAQ